MTPDHQYLHRGTAIMIAATAGGFFFGYVFNLWLARLLVPADYGDYKVAQAFFEFFAVVVVLGGTRAAARFLPPFLQSRDRAGVWGYVRFYLLITLGCSVVLFAITFGIAYLHRGTFTLSQHHPLVFGTCIVPVLAASKLMGRLIHADRRLALGVVPPQVADPMIRLVLVFVVVGLLGGVTELTVLELAFLATFLVLIFQFFMVQKLDLMPVRRTRHLANYRQWLTVSIAMMLVLIFQLGSTQVDLYMIELLTGEEDVGHFAAASTTVNSLVLVQVIVVGILTPLMTEAIKSGSKRIMELQAWGIRLLALLSIPCTVVIAVWTPEIMAMFGPSYGAAIPVLLVLLPGYLISSVLGLSAIWLQYAGHEKRVVIVMTSALAIQIVLNAMLIPVFGIVGAAAATSLSLGIVALIMSFMMQHFMNVSPWPLSR